MLTLIAAVARNGVIGIDNRLPFRLPEDLKRFKALTMNHPIIMGRKTWQSLPRALPGRHNIVISRQTGFAAEGATVVTSLDAALAIAGNVPAFVIGGAEIYALALPRADMLELTEVAAEVAGDVWFPDYDKDQWQEATRTTHHDDAAQLDYDFVTYRRVA
ncbi:MAG: dihydrofolate reductase [Rhodocyclaceae bacterium]|jgi:dihydrofolate reductase|nr:dihydrofolate reductase [Rhodocyclaceae bacterium]